MSANLKPGVLSAAHAWVQASPVLITAPPPPHTKMADKDSSNHKQHMAADAHESPSRAGSKCTQLVSDPRPRSTTQLLPDSITHQVMMFDPKKSNLEKLVLRCLQWYKAQGQKVLLFMGDQGKLVQLAERLTAGAGSVKVSSMEMSCTSCILVVVLSTSLKSDVHNFKSLEHCKLYLSVCRCFAFMVAYQLIQRPHTCVSSIMVAVMPCWCQMALPWAWTLRVLML